jgi:metal-responsive CopG/Arc/MetJ family transcriptional regulator
MSKAYTARNAGKNPNRRIVTSMTLPAWLAEKVTRIAKEAGMNRSQWIENELLKTVKKDDESNPNDQ